MNNLFILTVDKILYNICIHYSHTNISKSQIITSFVGTHRLVDTVRRLTSLLNRTEVKSKIQSPIVKN